MGGGQEGLPQLEKAWRTREDLCTVCQAIPGGLRHWAELQGGSKASAASQLWESMGGGDCPDALLPICGLWPFSPIKWNQCLKK